MPYNEKKTFFGAHPKIIILKPNIIFSILKEPVIVCLKYHGI